MYYIDCDTRHELGSDAPRFVCGIKYPCDEESVSKHGNIIPLSMARVACYQVRATFGPETGGEIPAGGNTPRTNNEWWRDGEASGNNINITSSVSIEEWAAASDSVINNTSLPVGVSACTLNAYHAILEKNRSRLAKERPNLN